MHNLSRSQASMALLGKALSTPAGRNRVASLLGPSLRRRRDYMSIARKGLMVETLPQGALPIYDKEFDETGRSFVEAFVVGEEGGDIVRIVKPKRVTVPTFDITAAPLIPITQIQERRFDVVERTLNLSKAEIGATEEATSSACWTPSPPPPPARAMTTRSTTRTSPPPLAPSASPCSPTPTGRSSGTTSAWPWSS